MPVIINQETGPAIVLFLQTLSLQNTDRRGTREYPSHGFQLSHLSEATVALPNLPCLIILHRKRHRGRAPIPNRARRHPRWIRRSGQCTDSLSEKSHRLCDDTPFVIDEL